MTFYAKNGDSIAFEVDHDKFMAACTKVADHWIENAHAVRVCDDWGSHVSEQEKDEILIRDIAHSEEVRRGEIKTFTDWQLVNYELTGNCIALLG